jgi:uncharacterized protein
MTDYDPRYLAGVLLFNRQDYFEAHEAWEDLWSEAHGNERKFYQGLIQAAVGLCHFCNGNTAGAVKLYRSSRDYLEPCGARFLGLDLEDFHRHMEECFRELLASSPPRRDVEPDPDRLPELTLDPPPQSWPDPEAYLHDED